MSLDLGLFNILTICPFQTFLQFLYALLGLSILMIGLGKIAQKDNIGLACIDLSSFINTLGLNALIDIVKQLVRIRQSVMSVGCYCKWQFSFGLLPRPSHFLTILFEQQEQQMQVQSYASVALFTVLLQLPIDELEQYLNIYFSIYLISMHNNSQKSARPLLFNTKRDIFYNVMGNTSQAYSVSIPHMPNKTAPAFYPSSSLFDRYNRPNLLLRDCDSKDIITLHKNLVMSEQPLSKDVVQEIIQKAGKNTVKEMAMTGQLFKKENVVDHLLQTVPSVPTREYQQNEIFFNYKEMAQIKRDKKMQFLEEIENRIAEAEQQIAGLENLQAQEKIEMGDLTRFQQKIGEQLTRNVQVGKVKQKVGYVTGFQEEEYRQPISIHQEMQPRQINEVLEEHIKINEDLLELAGSVRRKSLEKAKDKLEKTGQNANTFSSTMYRTNQQSKTLVSTMKAGFKPPKAKPKK